MATGTDSGEGTERDTGPRPITSPFDWGLGSASAPVPAEHLPAATRPEPYFSSDSDEDLDPASSSASFDHSQFDSPIDSLFGETKFRDYEGEPMVRPIPAELNPFAGAAPVASASARNASPRTPPVEGPPRGPPAPFSKKQRLLFWLAGAMIALLVLVLAVLFVVGTKVPPAPAPVAATMSAKPKVSPLSTSIAVPTGHAAVGSHLWSDLRGGECVDPYSSPFELNYTVVDCAAPHPAQMVFRGTFPGEAAAAYPGLDALQAQINLLCTAPGIIDLATAGAYNDIQFQASYAATTEEWAKGQHDYFCFVNRSGGEPITGSVAGTPAK